MCSVVLSFLGLICLLLSMINAWDLPSSCQPPQSPHPPHPSPPNTRSPIPPINDDNTTTNLPTKNPTTDPTKNPTDNPSSSPTLNPTIPTNSPTPQPTTPWDIECCEAIQAKYYYHANDPDSLCGPYHDSNVASCRLNIQHKIETINLKNCSLSGSIPINMQYMNHLRTLDLSYNALDGIIPHYFNNYNLFPVLQRFYASFNNLQGTIPFNLFQYEQLRYIDFQQNKRLIFDITNLNLTDSPVLHSKPAIAANFSFLNIRLDNDTDASLYIFFDTLRFSSFSMRSSVNNFTFNWVNRKDANSFHTIYANQQFDIYGNNITGEFPCHFKSVPVNFYVADNFIKSWNITCYQSKTFGILMIFQKEEAYQNQSKCYGPFGSWANTNDHNKYCMYVRWEGAPSALRDCCSNIPIPTKQPTPEPETADNKIGITWFLDNIEWFVLLLILSFACIIYAIWKQKKQRPIPTENRTPRRPKVSTNDKESLLYGDF